MATQKIPMALETSAIERARRAGGPRGLSPNADTALEDKLERNERRRALLDYLDDLEADDPTPDPAKQRAGRRAARIRSAASS
jgi:hypothetical protein